MKMVGIRCDVVAKDDVYYLLFYDIDREELTASEYLAIQTTMAQYNISYLVYKTKHGHHIVGLSPLNILQHAMAFSALKKIFNEYYGGIVIRISRKENEEQQLVLHNETNGEVIPNLFNLFAERFNLKKKPWRKEFSKYLLVFVRYRTDKN